MPDNEPDKKLDKQAKQEVPKEPEQRDDEETGPPVGEQEDVNEREAESK